MLSILLRRNIFVASSLNRKQIDYSRVPKLEEGDLEEDFVRGSGPGGQAVNKTSNCVILKHLPTGIVIRCHQTRTLQENRKIARELLITKLDNLVNGEMSVEHQLKVIELKKSREKTRRQLKLQKLKEAWRKNENTD